MKKLIYYGFWKEALEDIVKFLEEKDYQDTALIAHMKEVLHGTEKQ